MATIGTPGGTPERPALFFTGPEEFRAWLAANHDSAPELWMGLRKKHVPDRGLTWEDAVPEALCYGWIDSVAQRLDADTTRQRWTPRRRTSIWSSVNIALVEQLTAQGRMQPAGLAAYALRKPERSGIYAYEKPGDEPLPSEMAAQLGANPVAAQWFDAAPPSYRKLAIHWVLSAKQQATREKRLAELIDDSAHGRLIKPQRYGTEPAWVAKNRAAFGIGLLALSLLLGACTGSPPPATAASSAAVPPAPDNSTPTSTDESPTSSATITGPQAPGPDWVAVENARPGTGDWLVGGGRVADPGTLDGYASAASVIPGEEFSVAISSTLGPVTVTAYRLGWYDGLGGRKVWSSEPVRATKQQAPTIQDGQMVVANWNPSLRIDTAGWPEGTYVLRLDAGKKAKAIPLTLRSQSAIGRLVVINAVSTYQAYNAWGGYSLYQGADGSFGTRAHRVSFDRPYDKNGAPILFTHEVNAIHWIEKQGGNLAYLTSLELDEDDAALTGAVGMLSLGHDEYWSTAMRHTVETARARGTNLAFLGANAVYWRVRFDTATSPDHRVMIGTKDAGLDPGQGPQTTAMWRQQPDPRPENSLTGMLYECFPASGAMVITDPDSFLFAGTKVVKGSQIPGLVGTEIDRAYPIPGTPANLHVVAHSPVACADRGDTFSDMTYYTTPLGAGVISTGSMLFTRALAGPDPRFGITQETADFARQVLGNVVRAMAAGPMASKYPAVGNLAGLNAPTTTGTGTGGPVGR